MTRRRPTRQKAAARIRLDRSHNLRLCKCRHDANSHVNVPERGGCLICGCLRFRFKLYLGSPRRSLPFRELQRGGNQLRLGDAHPELLAQLRRDRYARRRRELEKRLEKQAT